MKRLAIDIETYSPVDISLGVYKYAEDPGFRVLLFAYQIDDGPVKVLDVGKEGIPEDLVRALCDPAVLKTAYNAQFERVCLNTFLGISSGPWECTMIKAWNVGITGGLDAVSKALGVAPDKEKMKEGARLIRKFCKDQRKTKARPSTLPYSPEEAPEDWEVFKDYTRRDVEVESFIREKLAFFEITPEEEKRLYVLDQKINDQGIRIDLPMARNAIKIIEEQDRKYSKIFQETTGIDRPSLLQQFKEWLSGRGKGEVSGITKVNQDDLYRLFADDPEAKKALDCRYNTGKTSTKKYDTMVKATGRDGRMRGTLQFYGAQTGRWAGRLLQVQNLPQNHIKDLDTARSVVKEDDFDFLEMLYDDPSDILRQCIRPTIIPEEGKVFAVADYSAIEARVIAYLAGEDWVLDVFRTTGKIYEATAAKMLGIPIESVKKPSPERQKGKVATLALGYQGGVGSLKAMGALKMGIPEEELQGIVDQWRAANRKIVSYWYEVEEAVRDTLEDFESRTIRGKVKTSYSRRILFLHLPSGRKLSYPKMRITRSKRFEGMDQLSYGLVKTGGSWYRQETYGGRLVENIVQATARDVLGRAMLRLDEEGYRIVMHVHDEVICEVDREEAEAALKRMAEIMGEEIPWAKGLPLTADGYLCGYYRKD